MHYALLHPTTNPPLTPCTAMTNKFLAPVLSAQLMTAPTGRAKEMRNLAPAEPPRPGKQTKNNVSKSNSQYQERAQTKGVRNGQ